MAPVYRGLWRQRGASARSSMSHCKVLPMKAIARAPCSTDGRPGRPADVLVLEAWVFLPPPRSYIVGQQQQQQAGWPRAEFRQRRRARFLSLVRRRCGADAALIVTC